MVDVNTQNKTIRVNVSSSGVSSNVNASGDTTLYYSNKAKEWATSNRIVDGVDYSSKYYAGRANESALNAQSFAQSAQDSYNNFQQSVDGALSTVNDTVQGAITTIDTKSDEAIETINNSVDGVIEDINKEFEEEKQEIEDLANLIKENAEDIANRTSFAMFDTILKDHILTYEQSKGWALQGTYVYKEAVAGSRYGYPDFYNKCTEEKELGTPTETTLGENTITLYVNPNGHTFYDIADKGAIDAWYNTYGIAWYYGIDTENERIFLPRTKWFIQPSGEITEVNTVNEAGLPNIEGSVGRIARFSTNFKSGAFNTSLLGQGNWPWAGANAFPSMDIYFNASDSNPIYGNSDTVQPPSINQLLYICVGNTNVESAVTDVVDVTTTENDTMPLFTGMYFDFTPNNVSWLKAGEQKNNEGIYRTCYNDLVNILNGETKYGDLKVINVADMEVSVDYSEYWKVNQEDMTFITPTVISNKALSGGIMGNGMTLGLTDGTNLFGLTNANDTQYNNRLFQTSAYGVPVGSSDTTGIVSNALTYGITTDSTKSGIVAEQSTSQLYFKVANAVQNLELLDAGEVLESLADKISRQDCKAYVTETYVNGTSWYRVYSDGWCEQGGIIAQDSENNYLSPTITFMKPFLDTNYNIQMTNGGNATSYTPLIQTKEVSSCSFSYVQNIGGNRANWCAKGYII